jgi:hypothetical protein
MAKVCIICEKEPQPGTNYYRVKDDAVIRVIRAIKQRFGVARNNELCVDQGCLPKYRERRKRFERNMVFYVALGVILFVLINGVQAMAGMFSLVAFVASVFLALLIAALAVLNYATPPIDESPMSAGPAAVPASEPGAPAAKEERKPAAKAGKTAGKGRR